MICYKDMTFCGFYKQCEFGSKCHRALTPKIKNDANDFGLPICEYGEKPQCFEQLMKIKGKKLELE